MLLQVRIQWDKRKKLAYWRVQKRKGADSCLVRIPCRQKILQFLRVFQKHHIPIGCILPALYCTGGLPDRPPWTETPWTESPPRQRPPSGQRAPPERDPLDRDPPPGQRPPLLDRDPSLDQDPLPQTETSSPQTETPSPDTDPLSLDRDPKQNDTHEYKNITFPQLRLRAV